MAQVVCVGDLLIDFVPTATGTGLADAPAFVKAPGGAAANVAVGLARLGVSSAFMGMVGDDPFGHFLADTLRQAGVDTGPLRFTSQARTALAFVSLRADGEREFMFYRHPSADMLLTPAEVDTGAIASGEGAALRFDQPRQPELRAPRACSPPTRRGRPAIWSPTTSTCACRSGPTPTPRGPGSSTGLAKAQVVKLSDDELEFLTGSRATQAVRQLWHDGLQLVTLSRGSAGSTWLTATGRADVPTLKVAAVDTTGAGDGFMAGLIHGLLADPDAPPTPRASPPSAASPTPPAP